jgi:hypothetical protein
VAKISLIFPYKVFWGQNVCPENFCPQKVKFFVPEKSKVRGKTFSGQKIKPCTHTIRKPFTEGQ